MLPVDEVLTVLKVPRVLKVLVLRVLVLRVLTGAKGAVPKVRSVLKVQGAARAGMRSMHL